MTKAPRHRQSTGKRNHYAPAPSEYLIGLPLPLSWCGGISATSV
jgi:hypothetical protein